MGVCVCIFSRERKDVYDQNMICVFAPSPWAVCLEGDGCVFFYAERLLLNHLIPYFRSNFFCVLFFFCYFGMLLFPTNSLVIWEKL